MRSCPQYVLDANVFIEAARRYYAFDIAPQFWSTLVQSAENQRILSIDRVRDEIVGSDDDLAKWANNAFREWFISTNEPDIINAYALIMQWAHADGHYTQAARADFAQAENADAWVVAYAHVNGCTVVTHEVFEPNARRRIKVPNACRAFDVPYSDVFGMLRDLGIKLV